MNKNRPTGELRQEWPRHRLGAIIFWLMTIQSWKHFFVGQPLETLRLSHERLPKWKALAIFASDALSSVAYATQEILIPLALVSMAATTWSLPIALAIAVLLIVVATSYWQTIREYPRGGGAYTVVMENLGITPGLITGAAILIDYVLTVSVSISAGLEAIGSAIPFLFEHRVVLGCFCVAVVTLINLRGVRESGSFFALPTYLFIFSISALLITATYQFSTGTLIRHAGLLHEHYEVITATLVLRAFASGCAALTGIEAISDGVPTFKKPESRNAQITLVWMTIILASFFVGITSIAHLLGITPQANETVVSQISRNVFGTGILYYCVQLSTALILFLAANTSFADFPRVCSLLAKDRFLPRQFASLGDRLVFSNGIVILGLLSALLIIIFRGTTHYLIPLYAIGVFLSFTLSQAGMVIRHVRFKKQGWFPSVCISSFGAFVTLIVLCVITFTKFTHGAWIVVLLIPLHVAWFRLTRSHYRQAAAQLALVDEMDISKPIKHTVIVPISGIHNGVIDALKYAKSIAKDVRVVYVELEEAATDRMKATWKRLNSGLPLVVLPSPYRSVVRPIIDYVRNVEKECDDDIVTVVIPEFVTARWWHGIFHNQTALMIRTALLFEKNKVVTSVRYHLRR